MSDIILVEFVACEIETIRISPENEKSVKGTKTESPAGVLKPVMSNCSFARSSIASVISRSLYFSLFHSPKKSHLDRVRVSFGFSPTLAICPSVRDEMPGVVWLRLRHDFEQREIQKKNCVCVCV